MITRTLRTAALAAALATLTALPAVTLAQSPSAAPAVSAAPAAAVGLDGTWSIDPTIGTFDYDAGDFSGNWVGYRVQEELAGVGGVEAVGRTPDVTGTITLQGTTLTAADLTADLTTLRSDQSMRDGQLGRQGIETDRFPTATFVLTTPIELGTLPAEGEQLTVDATGDLTLHGVTKNVTIPLGVVRIGDIIGAAGSITFTWADFGMEQPTSMRVVSLADDVTMELQVFFRKDAAVAASPVASAAAAASPAASAAPAARVSATNASEAELVAALEAAGVASADRWAREIMEYRPYDAADPTLQHLQDELAKYNPDPATLDAILSVLVP